MSYYSDGKVSGISIPNGKTLQYSYLGDDLVSYKDALGNETKYAYDSTHQMLSWTDANGNKVIDNTYDGEGRVTKQKDAQNHESQLQFNAGNTIATDNNGNITTYYFDSAFRTTKIAYPDGTTEEKNYDSLNNLNYEIDKNGNKTQYEYNLKGNITKQIRFDGKFKSYEYNSLNKITKIVDYDRKQTQYEYDSVGDLTKQIDNNNQHITYEYDNKYRLIKMKDCLNKITQYEYNGAWLSAKIDALGNRTEYYYNSMGLLTSTIDANGKTTRYMYDYEGRKTGEQL